ncbi:unnamed protein product [Amoebophrya sp. A120]|nr:unnamed protein product [Amoebophrya sp. A120]|eukprot:GSA120T00026019001.1
MLQAYKNEVVADVSIRQAELRQLELDYYVANYWLWCGASTIVGGFLFNQLTTPIPYETSYLVSSVYLSLTSGAFGASVCTVTWTVFLAMWGPGLALRGPDGIASFHRAVDFLKKEQESVYLMFKLAILLYFFSSILLTWVFPSRFYVHLSCMLIFAGIFAFVFLLERSMKSKLKGFSIETLQNENALVDGKIESLKQLGKVGDLDESATISFDQDYMDRENHQQTTQFANAAKTNAFTTFFGGGGSSGTSAAAHPGGDTKRGEYHHGLYDTTVTREIYQENMHGGSSTHGRQEHGGSGGSVAQTVLRSLHDFMFSSPSSAVAAGEDPTTASRRLQNGQLYHGVSTSAASGIRSPPEPLSASNQTNQHLLVNATKDSVLSTSTAGFPGGGTVPLLNGSATAGTGAPESPPRPK